MCRAAAWAEGRNEAQKSPFATGAAELLPRVGKVLRLAGALVVAGWATAGMAVAAPFGFDDVDQRARQLASGPYRSPPDVVATEMKRLSYNALRDIRFLPDNAVWRKEALPFELMFFHLGKFNTLPVQINEVTSRGIKPIKFNKSDFDYGRNAAQAATWGSAGFAGFRVHQALNTPNYKDEVLAFLGASYFRALGRGQNYGLSARGLAIDTGSPQGEEFPRFSTFWIERPAGNAQSLLIYALLESNRLAGAYRFELHPGTQTAVDVRAKVYLRAGVTTFGVAPLTSMFYSGENQPVAGEFRPEVHDSDGLSIESATGEWIWRPLINPGKAVTTSFALPGVRGFGLMQRDRSFSSYEDVEARYDTRPSAWVVPVGDWGPGRVELLQYPAPDETHDNVVAYWVPQTLPVLGQPIEFAYRLLWQGADSQRPPSAWAYQSRAGRGPVAFGADEFQYVVDFVGPSLRALPPDAVVQPVVTGNTNVRVLEQNVYFNPALGGWRLTVHGQRVDTAQPVELRAFLQAGTTALTETWTTLIPAR